MAKLKDDIIMVGYRFENDKVNDWLASTSTSREQLWWVRPDGPQRDINDWASVVSFIDGDGKAGNGDYVNKQDYPVLTRGNPSELSVRVERI